MINYAGDWLGYIALMLYVFNLTGSGTAIAGLAAFEALPAMLLGPWAGIVADRFPRKRVMIAASLGQAVLMVALPFTQNLWCQNTGGMTMDFNLDDFTFTAEFTVRYHETDAMGHTSNVSYFGYLEYSRLTMFKLAGLVDTHDRDAPTNWEWVLVHAYCNFRRPSFFDDVLQCYARVTDMTRSTVSMQHLVIHKDTGELIAEGGDTIVHINPETGRSQPLTEAIIERLRAFQK